MGARRASVSGPLRRSGDGDASRTTGRKLLGRLHELLHSRHHRHGTTPDGPSLVALAATSIFSIGAQLLLTFSLRWLDAMTVGVISQLAVIISMALGATLLGETLTPMAIVGAALTIGGVVGVVYVTSIVGRTPN